LKFGKNELKNFSAVQRQKHACNLRFLEIRLRFCHIRHTSLTLDFCFCWENERTKKICTHLLIRQVSAELFAWFIFSLFLPT